MNSESNASTAVTIIVAPNAFKGSLTAKEAAMAMNRGIHRADPEIRVIQIPVSDGGDGLVEAVAEALDGESITVRVQDPRRRPVEAAYLFDRTRCLAVIEMALASGLALISKDLQNPCLTTTLGTGQLIRHALDQGAEQILLGIGGSATCDGGMGAAAALGYRFLDHAGKELPPAGASLNRITAIDTTDVDPRIFRTRFSVACDVTNPLTGPEGASFVFSPQKGATPDQVKALDHGLDNLGRVVARDLDKDILTLEGGGAAGGLGAAMKAFFNAELTPGINLVLGILGFEDQVRQADLVLTAEGRMDSQTRFNKAPAGVALAARAAGVPCIGLCGSIGRGTASLHDIGMTAVFSLCSGPLSIDTAMADASELLVQASEQAVRAFLSGRSING